MDAKFRPQDFFDDFASSASKKKSSKKKKTKEDKPYEVGEYDLTDDFINDGEIEYMDTDDEGQEEVVGIMPYIPDSEEGRSAEIEDDEFSLTDKDLNILKNEKFYIPIYKSKVKRRGEGKKMKRVVTEDGNMHLEPENVYTFIVGMAKFMEVHKKVFITSSSKMKLRNDKTINNWKILDEYSSSIIKDRSKIYDDLTKVINMISKESSAEHLISTHTNEAMVMLKRIKKKHIESNKMTKEFVEEITSWGEKLKEFIELIKLCRNELSYKKDKIREFNDTVENTKNVYKELMNKTKKVDSIVQENNRRLEELIKVKNQLTLHESTVSKLIDETELLLKSYFPEKM